jgi:dipeptidyl aminopeptidase/acylaminoacyl peptidase
MDSPPLFRTRKNSVILLVSAAVLTVLVAGCICPQESLPASRLPISSPIDSPLPFPTSGQILYHSNADGDFDIYVTDTEGVKQQLTNSSDDDIEAAWSTSGDKIAFSSKRNGNYEIYVMDSDGNEQTRLTENDATDWGPTWSRDDQSIAFASDRTGKMHLFVMNTDGTNQRSIVAEKEMPGWAPAWSPTRDEIVFVSDQDGDSELYLLQLQSGKVTQLTFNDRQDERPAWSPDGDYIVYMGAKTITNLFDPDEIYIIPRSGGTPRQMTDNLFGDITPTWSPDGRSIAFSSSREGGWNIYVMPVSGEQEPYRLTYSNGWSRSPCWGP